MMRLYQWYRRGISTQQPSLVEDAVRDITGGEGLVKAWAASVKRGFKVQGIVSSVHLPLPSYRS